MKRYRILIILTVILGLWGIFYVSESEGPVFFLNWHRVAVDDNKARVLELLGQPDRTIHEFALGQREGYEAEYKRAENSGAKYFMSWTKGIDVVFTVGFDDNNNVKVKAYGGT